MMTYAYVNTYTHGLSCVTFYIHSMNHNYVFFKITYVYIYMGDHALPCIYTSLIITMYIYIYLITYVYVYIIYIYTWVIMGYIIYTCH